MGKSHGKKRVVGVGEGYDLYACSYDEDLKFLDSFEKGDFYGMIGNVNGKRIIDLGCGSGRMIPWLLKSGADVTCVDVSSKMIEIVNEKFPMVSRVVGDVQDLSGLEGDFDCAVAAFLIVHLKTLGRFFEEVYGILKEGGEFVVSNINQRKPPVLETADGEKIVIKSFYHRPCNVIDSLLSNGFEIVDEQFVYEGNAWINQIIKARKI